MVKLNKIYTRTGDRGETGIVGHVRLPKHHQRLCAIGDVDEANAAIGLVSAQLEEPDALAMLQRIQQDLFDLGADIATLVVSEKDLRIQAEQVARLEHEIDAMNAALSPLESFILPGGRLAAAALHLARTVVRRAERQMTALNEHELLNPHALCYINRLSDHLFVLSRIINGGKDHLWLPGANQ